MDVERARAFLLTLPHVAETMQWGANLVFWTGEKSLGGKMFCLINLDADSGPVRRAPISFAAGPERFADLLEREGFSPAPYFARAHWVAVESWSALRPLEWEEHLRAAHALVFARLPQRTRTLLALPAKEREGFLRKRKKPPAQRTKISAARPKPSKPTQKRSKRT